MNIVLNVINNHIHNVAHGATGDSYYGAIGHSAVGGQGGRNDIRNSQTSEISEFAAYGFDRELLLTQFPIL